MTRFATCLPSATCVLPGLFAVIAGFVLSREISDATNAYLVIRRYSIDTAKCDWIAELA